MPLCLSRAERLPPAVSSTATALPGESGTRYAFVGVARDDVLNIRADAGVAHPIIGTIPPYGTDVGLLPGEKQVGGSTWVAARYGEIQGWVNRAFLAEQFGQADPVLVGRSADAIQAIQEGDFHRLSQLVHPQRGLRFSAHGYIRMEDLVINASQISGLFTDPDVYLWGYYDGSGDLIELTFADYYWRFVYDVEFARPESIGFDQLLGRGNTINNISQYYPQARFVEHHFSGFDPQYGGLDWRSLRLVFELFEGTWYLVSVVHDEWTT